jgi:CheY-like chemotaxis protein
VTPFDKQAFMTALAGASLALIDAGTADRPWAKWVSAAKTDPVTRGTPIIAFGSHVDRAVRERALEAGVDRYMARSNFVGALPEIMARAAREVTDNACGEPLPEGVLRGIQEFDEGRYFEQHETLERVWRAETRPVRYLYQGILQIGVALLHIERNNAPGAIKTFERAFPLARAFSPLMPGVDVRATSTRIPGGV